ncbi:hypothetical protein SpCBS45565_g06624 [Spizellomyces sp. 'palustris']|nr:hypothetical protein SpCBS45565_g06624 [Spizellomyces sp. 'palustris']
MGCKITAPGQWRTKLQTRALKTVVKARAPIREYFYYIDVHGQLFLHDTVPRNFTTCFKDKRFLDFFFSRLRLNDLQQAHARDGYRYVSPCGREMNYVQAEDAPIVFQDLTSDGSQLTYAGSHVHPFSPSSLYMSATSGRLYHPLPSALNLSPTWMLDDRRTSIPPLGLLRSSLVLAKLFDKLNVENGSVQWNGQEFALHVID